MIFKAALASQRWPSCPYKALSFQTLRHHQFLSNFQSPKFKLSDSGKKNVRLFDKNISTFWKKHTFNVRYNLLSINIMASFQNLDKKTDVFQFSSTPQFLSPSIRFWASMSTSVSQFNYLLTQLTIDFEIKHNQLTLHP